MNEHIRSLIDNAGFSNTYEVERLVKLCQLAALSCVDSVLRTENTPKAVASIVTNFNLETQDEYFE